MSVIYSWIGIWALLDPVAGALDLGWPSFSVAIGLSVTSEIGYSEIAGIYGGLNFCIGLACLLGIFKKDIGILARNGFSFETSKRIMDLSKDEYEKIIRLL